LKEITFSPVAGLVVQALTVKIEHNKTPVRYKEFCRKRLKLVNVNS